LGARPSLGAIQRSELWQAAAPAAHCARAGAACWRGAISDPYLLDQLGDLLLVLGAQVSQAARPRAGLALRGGAGDRSARRLLPPFHGHAAPIWGPSTHRRRDADVRLGHRRPCARLGSLG
jgi:hypothetical protein